MSDKRVIAWPRPVSSQRQIKRGAHKSLAAFKAAIEELLTAHNNSPKPFV
jgi:hypothetical protein